jgi:protein-S-isoprenylcysteine O-methyltransferase Ste14
VSELLDALGVKGQVLRPLAAIGVWVSFSIAMVGIAAGQALIEYWLRLPAVAVILAVGAVWVMWSWWHSVLFGRHRSSYLRSSSNPYRRAFLVDVFPGIAVGFSQMLRPSWNGSNLRLGAVWPHLPHSAGDGAIILTGWFVGLCSLALFAAAWRTLGAAGAGFVSEFVRSGEFRPTRAGPYGHVRHPLFWSGVGVSWALALVSGTKVGLWIAVLNTGYGLLYNQFEDRRLIAVFGDRYREYAETVPHIVPRLVTKHLAPVSHHRAAIMPSNGVETEASELSMSRPATGTPPAAP